MFAFEAKVSFASIFSFTLRFSCYFQQLHLHLIFMRLKLPRQIFSSLTLKNLEMASYRAKPSDNQVVFSLWGSRGRVL